MQRIPDPTNWQSLVDLDFLGICNLNTTFYQNQHSIDRNITGSNNGLRPWTPRFSQRLVDGKGNQQMTPVTRMMCQSPNSFEESVALVILFLFGDEILPS